MRVLVVARTRMYGDRVCVGGIEMDTGRSLRLMGSDGRNLSEEHPVRPGEVWELVYEEPRRGIKAPHVEDVIVSRGHKERDANELKTEILSLWTPWECPLDEIFDGTLDTTESGTAFVPESGPVPNASTGFWLAQRSASFDAEYHRYRFGSAGRIRSAKYVGMEEAAQLIRPGSVVRFSLARWWKFDPDEEERCFLQLSAVYP